MDPTPAFIDHAAVDRVASRARLAQVTLALSFVAGGWDLGCRVWSIALIGSYQRGGGATMDSLLAANAMMNLGTSGAALLVLANAVLFLRWMHGLVAATRALGNDRLRWMPADAVWAFIIPFISLYRPYEVLRDVHNALEPDDVPPPAPRVTAGEQDGYRGVTVVEAPPPPRLPSSLIGLWWATFLLSRFAGFSGSITPGAEAAAVVSAHHGAMFVDLVSMTSAALAVVVVRGVTARLLERRRRLAWALPVG